MFKVYDKPCQNCLLTKNRLVSEERAQELLESCKEDGTHFICHKASINDEDVCCHVFYKLYLNEISKLQIFTRLNMITYIPMPEHDPLYSYKEMKNGKD